MNKKEKALYIFLLIVAPICLGILSFLFQFTIPYCLQFTNWLWENVPHYAYFLILLFLSLVEIFVIWLDNLHGDINDIEDYLRHNLPYSPLLDIVSVFICACITFMIGLPLDGDLPTIFMVGTLFVVMLHRFFKRYQRHTMIHMGASIGFALAFHNPIAGIVHYFEEYRHRFKWKPFFLLLLEIVIAYSTLTGLCFLKEYLLEGKVNPFAFFYELFDVELSFGNNVSIFFISFGIILIICCLLSFVLNKAVIFFRDYFDPKTWLSVILCVVLASAFAYSLRRFDFELAIGMGEELFEARDLLSSELIILFALRIVFIIFAFNFFHIGGRTVPSLMLGALIGQIFVAICNEYFTPLDHSFANLVIICSALIYLGVSMKVYLIAVSLSFSFGNPLFILPIVVIALLIAFFPMKYILPLGLNEEIEEHDEHYHFILYALNFRRHPKKYLSIHII